MLSDRKGQPTRQSEFSKVTFSYRFRSHLWFELIKRLINSNVFLGNKYCIRLHLNNLIKMHNLQKNTQELSANRNFFDYCDMN